MIRYTNLELMRRAAASLTKQITICQPEESTSLTEEMDPCAFTHLVFH